MELNNLFLVLLHLVLAASYAHCWQRLCGSALANAVSFVCGERGTYAGDSTHDIRKRSLDNVVERGQLYSGVQSRVRKISNTINAESSPFRGESEAKSFLGASRQKRRTGLIVHECCNNICSLQIIESYCNPWPEETTTTTTTTHMPEVLPTEQREGNYLTDDVQMEHLKGHEENRVGLLSDGSEFRDETPMSTERTTGRRSHHTGHDQSTDIDSGFHRSGGIGTDVEESDSDIDNPSSERQDPSSVRIDHEPPTSGPHGYHHDNTGGSRRGGGRSNRRRNNGRRPSRRRNKRKRPKRSASVENINAEETLKQIQRLHSESQLTKVEHPPNQDQNLNQDDKDLRRRVSIGELSRQEIDNKSEFSLQVSDLPNLTPRLNQKSPIEGRSKKVENIKSGSFSIDNINKQNQRILSFLINPKRRLRIMALTGVFKPLTSNHPSRRRILSVIANNGAESAANR